MGRIHLPQNQAPSKIHGADVSSSFDSNVRTSFSSSKKVLSVKKHWILLLFSYYFHRKTSLNKGFSNHYLFSDPFVVKENA